MFRIVLLFGVSSIPLGWLRVQLLRRCFGYKISNDSRIGWFSVLNVQNVQMEKAVIGLFNYIQCQSFKMEKGSYIGRMNIIRSLCLFSMASDAILESNNRIFGTRHGLSPFKQHECMRIGAGSIVTSNHLFDVSDSIEIGVDVTFAGSGTQVWTHGFDLDHVKVQAPIEIGDHTYIGSRSVILKGVKIANRVSIGAGSVIASSILEPGFYVSSHLVRKSDCMSYKEHADVIEFKGARFVRK